MIAPDWKDYEVIAAGGGEKLERWGGIYLLRPDPQAIWTAPFDLSKYPKLHARYLRASDGGGRWQFFRNMPEEWTIGWRDCKFLIKPMGFKHTGLFPEQAYNWDRMGKIADGSGKRLNVLNLFGYTGGASVALAKRGAFVTHVDAAKGMVDRCRQNAKLSGVPDDGIRYIVDDCKKFVQREIKRGKRYDAVLMDPAVLRQRTVRRNVETRRQPVRTRQPRYRSTRRSAVLPHQQLYHRTSTHRYQKYPFHRA